MGHLSGIIVGLMSVTGAMNLLIPTEGEKRGEEMRGEERRGDERKGKERRGEERRGKDRREEVRQKGREM